MILPPILRPVELVQNKFTTRVSTQIRVCVYRLSTTACPLSNDENTTSSLYPATISKLFFTLFPRGGKLVNLEPITCQPPECTSCKNYAAAHTRYEETRKRSGWRRRRNGIGKKRKLTSMRSSSLSRGGLSHCLHSTNGDKYMITAKTTPEGRVAVTWLLKCV